MSKPTVVFEWQDLREDQELPSVPGGPAPFHASGPKRRQQLVVIGGAICLLLVALSAASWAMSQAEAGLAEIQNELVLAVDAEIWQGGDGRLQVFACSPNAQIRNDESGEACEIVPMDADLQNRIGLRDFDGSAPRGISGPERVLSVKVQALRQDVAAVMVVTEANVIPDAPPTAYRQLRFYRRTEDGWQPTEPVPDLWGQPKSLTTAHFDFTYRSRDAQAVAAVAAELDALYAQMRRNLGLSPTPDQKLTVEVVVSALSPWQVATRSEHTITTILSPALLRAPESLTDAAILRQAILLQLVDKGLEEADSTHWIPPRWYPMLSAMRLWQTWQLDGPLAAWREPILRWLYVDLPTTADDILPPLPAKYGELCALFRVWGSVPLQTGIPLLCHKSDKTAWYLAFSADRPWARYRDLISLPAYRSHLARPDARFGQPYYDEHFRYDNPDTYAQDRIEPVVTASLLDYIAATYGREQIGALWPILHEHKDWETLIPAAFGVSLEEFEASWQAYMAEQ